ncbi:leishmanolysin-like peptidase [Scenedesmus sp. PABB004]|nr:leishmanolysin-like peptidase [Scenedesmus sp. PABB004]
MPRPAPWLLLGLLALAGAAAGSGATTPAGGDAAAQLTGGLRRLLAALQGAAHRRRLAQRPAPAPAAAAGAAAPPAAARAAGATVPDVPQCLWSDVRELCLPSQLVYLSLRAKPTTLFHRAVALAYDRNLVCSGHPSEARCNADAANRCMYWSKSCVGADAFELVNWVGAPVIDGDATLAAFTCAGTDAAAWRVCSTATEGGKRLCAAVPGCAFSDALGGCVPASLGDRTVKQVAALKKGFAEFSPAVWGDCAGACYVRQAAVCARAYNSSAGCGAKPFCAWELEPFDARKVCMHRDTASRGSDAFSREFARVKDACAAARSQDACERARVVPAAVGAFRAAGRAVAAVVQERAAARSRSSARGARHGLSDWALPAACTGSARMRARPGVGAGVAGALVVLACLAVHAPGAEGGACSMDSPDIRDKYAAFAEQQLKLRAVRGAKERMQGERVRQMVAETAPAPIRIKLIMQLQGSYLPPDAKKRLGEQLAPGAVRILQKFVQVRVPRRFAIRMPRPPAGSPDAFCNDAYAAALWEGGGVRGADMVLFVTANQTKDCKAGALAYTLPCMTDMVTGRPIAAGMNICPLSQRSSPRRLLNTIVHESVHALGFSGQLFPLYYDSETWNPYPKSEQVAVQFGGAASGIVGAGALPAGSLNRTGGAAAMFIAFPAMRALAQRHFGCDRLPGAPADVGSLASHFKQRVSGHELMMPATSEDGAVKRITEFTLTLLESTGWYTTRMDLAQPANFGKGAGCDLAMESCGTFLARNPRQNYYCPADRENADQCTYDYKGIGVCIDGVDDDNCLLAGASVLRGSALSCQSASTWSTMRHQAFYFHHSTFGGTVGNPNSRCYQAEGATPPCMAAKASPGARAPGAAADPTCLMRQAMCLETRCTPRGEVEAVFNFEGSGSVAVPCPQGGAIDLAKQLPGRGFTSGRLKCPIARLVCPELACARPCRNGMCSNGRCVCDMEFTGPDCEVALVEGLT